MLRDLTPEQIRALPAGVNTDLLVAVEVYHWRPVEGKRGLYDVGNIRRNSYHSPNVSASLTEAGDLAAFLADKGWYVSVTWQTTGEASAFIERPEAPLDAPTYTADAPNWDAALAITRAVLLWARDRETTS